MRKCSNCYNGHYNLSDRGEELFCDESEYEEELVDSNFCCEYHRYYPGMSEEKNIVFYDEEFVAPGYVIANIKNSKIDKLLKFYNKGTDEQPFIGIIGLKTDYLDNMFDMTFRDIEDDKNGLYDYFFDLCENIEGVVSSVGNKNKMEIVFDSRIITITLISDQITDAINIVVGGSNPAMIELYQGLSKLCVNTKYKEDMPRLTLKK